MNNLLDGWNDEGASDDSDSDDDEVPDVEMGKKNKKKDKNNEQQQQQPDYMMHFFSEMDNIKADISAIGEATKQIQNLHEKALHTTTASEEAKLSKKLRPLIEGTNKRAQKSKTLLTLLKEETDKLKAEEALNASDVRVRQNLTTTLTRKFVDEMKTYQQSQQEYKTAIKTKAKRQIQAIQPDMSDEQVEDVLKQEGGQEQLMKQAVLSNTMNDQIQTAYNKVAGKYQDVLTLEQSVAELHQMFLDFALLTEQQGELLDQIEYQVKEANDHVESANEETVQAIEYQKKIRKKQCWIMGIAVGITLLMALLIFG